MWFLRNYQAGYAHRQYQAETNTARRRAVGLCFNHKLSAIGMSSHHNRRQSRTGKDILEHRPLGAPRSHLLPKKERTNMESLQQGRLTANCWNHGVRTGKLILLALPPASVVRFIHVQVTAGRTLTRGHYVALGRAVARIAWLACVCVSASR